MTERVAWPESSSARPTSRTSGTTTPSSGSWRPRPRHSPHGRCRREHGRARTDGTARPPSIRAASRAGSRLRSTSGMAPADVVRPARAGVRPVPRPVLRRDSEVPLSRAAIARRVCCVWLFRLPGAASAAGAAPRRRRALVARTGDPRAAVLVESSAGVRPDVVLLAGVTNPGAPQLDHMKAAMALGAPAAVTVWSWDHLSGKAWLRHYAGTRLRCGTRRSATRRCGCTACRTSASS